MSAQTSSPYLSPLNLRSVVEMSQNQYIYDSMLSFISGCLCAYLYANNCATILVPIPILLSYVIIKRKWLEFNDRSIGFFESALFRKIRAINLNYRSKQASYTCAFSFLMFLISRSFILASLAALLTWYILKAFYSGGEQFSSPSIGQQDDERSEQDDRTFTFPFTYIRTPNLNSSSSSDSNHNNNSRPNVISDRIKAYKYS